MQVFAGRALRWRYCHRKSDRQSIDTINLVVIVDSLKTCRAGVRTYTLTGTTLSMEPSRVMSSVSGSVCLAFRFFYCEQPILPRRASLRRIKRYWSIGHLSI